MSSDVTTPLPSSPFRGDILRGRVVLITGGATGIGYGCAEAFGGIKAGLVGIVNT